MKRSTGLIIAILSISTLLMAFFFFQALFSPDYLEKRVSIGEYSQSGQVDYSAEIKPNLIYEREKISGKDIVYSALLKKMNLVYSYSFFPPPENLEGNYSIKLLLTPTKGGWEKEIGAYTGSFSTPNFEVVIPLDWEMINLIWKEIENETKYDFGDPNLKFVADLSLNCSLIGLNLNERFLQTTNITYGKIISFSELNKSKKETVYSKVESKNTLNFFGLPIEVRNAKSIFGIPFFASFCLLGIFISVRKSEIAEELSKRRKKSFERKFRNKIVNTLEFPEYSNAIRVLKLGDIGKLSYELDRPILKFENTFAVVDGERVYVYDGNNNNIIREKK